VHSGDVIAGRYRLEESVGAGGMGEVWRATDLELRRVVALKHARTGDGEETRREARIGAGVHHPNVISVFDVIVEDDRRWLVMEYLPARSLAEIRREDGPVAPSLAARIGAQIATALSAMHAKGMVHRDITPANILVTEDGKAKLADLGIAMWAEVTVTGTARTAGTPGYLAPEVLRGDRTTPAADLYSLGMTLSAAIEGHPDSRLSDVLATLTDPAPARRPSADKAVQLFDGLAARRFPRRGVLVSIGVVALLVAAVTVAVSTSDGSVEPPASGSAKLLYGMGDKLNSVLTNELVRDSPIRMLTTNYHKADDLTWLASWRDTVVPDAYARGFALHVVVADWQEDDPEVPVQTRYGPGCGRPHPLSPEFLDDMRALARIFAGKAGGPPLYVTMFQEVNKFACVDGAYAENDETTAYYKALKDRYLEVRQIFKDEAPNAQMSLGWDGYQSEDDEPSTGGGRSMFGYFADVLRASDFQSVLAKQPYGNIDQVRRAVRILGEYGKVMVAAYGNKDTPSDIVDLDVRTLLNDESLADLTAHGLFAWNFNTERVLDSAGKPTQDYVRDVIRRTGRDPR
jgi:serine/threonine protein kinase